jgi:hypothetical protein
MRLGSSLQGRNRTTEAGKAMDVDVEPRKAQAKIESRVKARESLTVDQLGRLIMTPNLMLDRLRTAMVNELLGLRWSPRMSRL